MRCSFLRSLRFRLLFVSMLVEAVMLSVLVANSVRVIDQRLTQQAEVRIQIIEQAYRTALAVPLATRDYPAIQEFLNSWSSAADIHYLAVTDNQGRLRAAANWDPAQPLPEAGGLAAGGDIIHVRFPITYLGVAYGHAQFGLSSRFLSDARNTLFEQGVMISLAALGMTFLLLLATCYWLTRDFTALARASECIGRGDFGVRVALHGNDEVAAIGHSFNAMAEGVQQHIRELAESEQRFRAIADYTYGWENWFAPDGSLQWVNPAVERVTGYSVDECMAMADFPLPLVHEADCERVQRHLKLAQEGQSGQDIEFRILARDGQVRWGLMAGQRIRAEAGRNLGYRISIRDITLRHQAVEELVFAADHDALTGLNNRRAFEKQLSRELAAHHRDGRSLIIFYIDLDQFKIINDTCGHAAGDVLLQSLARMMDARFDCGFLARLGGDEFGMVLSGLDLAEAERRAQQIIDDICAQPFVWDGRSFHIGASIGIAVAGPETNSESELLIAADTACYAAKERGRNRFQVFLPNDRYFRERKAEFLSLSEISEALTKNRLLLYVQRIVPLHDGVEPYAEVLVRMRGEDGGIIQPGRFIPAAERFGMMPLIDRWVINAVCSQIAAWQADGVDGPRLHVNLSGLTLADPGLKEYIEFMFREHGIAPQRIGFEITESCAIAQLDLALDFIDFCRELGCELALDDFGSGLSSFGYLKRFKVHSLKIDGMFVRNADQDADDRAVIESIVRLAQHKRLHTVAEFVSSQAVLDTVRDLGVDYGQGFHLHQPEPLADLLHKELATG
ncbi:MAG: EAL domain-containing protein [Azonexus sp.]|jgi:diguanylate cyclase (GGDEF)-like protein/PAS domain S-box-containing protein|uniref:EAL domain-containing protein n=1 Tax=Azonexus sp. TaxID=1872668 RepID=UPI00281CBB34|nr:EAL domain-containing protein [Azonexus sp.]MDR0776867.1 EAL domain-containing protein [Azonexus sp.]